MDLTILKRIGLTDGEIKVYSALMQLGQARIFNIMKKSRVSSSKVYLILDKLIQKGFVSFIVEDGVKKYQITNPNNVLDYVNDQKKELDDFNKEFEKIIPSITSRIGSFEKESAQVYTGVKGISAGFQNILKELERGDEYYFFSMSHDELTSKNMMVFLRNFHHKRVSKGVRLKCIVHPSLKPSLIKKILHRNYEVKFYKLSLPTGMTIGKNRVLIPIFGDTSICYEIVSKRVAERYRNFFERIWKIAK